MLNQLRRGHRAWPMFKLKSGAAMAAPAAPMPPPLGDQCEGSNGEQMNSRKKTGHLTVSLIMEAKIPTMMTHGYSCCINLPLRSSHL